MCEVYNTTADEELQKSCACENTLRTFRCTDYEDETQKKRYIGFKKDSIQPTDNGILLDNQSASDLRMKCQGTTKDTPLASRSSIYGVTFKPEKIYGFGERHSGTKTHGPPQNYHTLLRHHLDEKTLFEDKEFPAADSSLFSCPNEKPSYVVWKRPHELVEYPQFFVEGFSRFDVIQGRIGNCWFLAAAASLAMHKKLFTWVVPEDQSFQIDYAGIFHFRFWHFGRWIDVVIDDMLPTMNGRLFFVQSSESDEFWSALLEKAYAKLYSCYEILEGGLIIEAMTDLTGGIVEVHSIDQTTVNLFEIMRKAYERNSLLGCSMYPHPTIKEAVTEEGLMRGHAYSITKVKTVRIKSHETKGGSDCKLEMLRLRNPWGRIEWRGAWCDVSEEWKNITEEDKLEMGLTFDDDGEFWMSYSDFFERFNLVEICNLNPDSLSQDDLIGERNKKWEMSVFEGEWVKGVSASGSIHTSMRTFWHNPQYRVTLREADENDDDKECTLVVALTQKYRRLKRAKNLNIGFTIYKVPELDVIPKPLNYNFFRYNKFAGISTFHSGRENTHRFKLPPGTYCIIPSTRDSNEAGEFLIRVFSEHPNNMAEHDKGIGRVVFEYGESEAQDKELLDTVVYEMATDLAGEGEELGWPELKEILDKTIELGEESGFSKDTCRSVMASVDYDRSGKLIFQELCVLWCAIRRWKRVFDKLDPTKKGHITGYHFRQALEDAGYTVNTRIMNKLMHRYGDDQRNIGFEDFVLCAIRLKTMIDLFESARDNNEVATFHSEEFIEWTMYS